MYYKIVSDGEIVDVCSGLNYVRRQSKNGIWLACGEENATGITTSDGSTIYLLEGAEEIDGYEYTTATEIDEETYEELRQELIDNGVLADTDSGTGTDDSESSEDTTTETVKKSKALLLAEQLQEELAALTEQNEMLLECLLEMSEVVYG
ncbi:MAG: hypothetical protein LUE24_14680 [Lachnospiraceae bacterium]|nr:hypothetical protein [Lachnospiraceae bacterium]